MNLLNWIQRVKKVNDLDEKASYLWFAIMKDYMKTSTKEYIFNFALNQYHRKNMIERNAFAVWLGLMVWKRDILTILMMMFLLW